MVVTVPPCLADLPSGRYAVAGSTWIRVPDDTKFEDLDKYMTYESKRPESPSDASETVFLNGKPIKRSEALEMVAERPKPLTVGSLVRHVPTGGAGLITKHTMWDANWGAFYVDFVKPVDNVVDGRVANQLDRIFDRGDMFERV